MVGAWAPAPAGLRGRGPCGGGGPRRATDGREAAPRRAEQKASPGRGRRPDLQRLPPCGRVLARVVTRPWHRPRREARPDPGSPGHELRRGAHRGRRGENGPLALFCGARAAARRRQTPLVWHPYRAHSVHRATVMSSGAVASPMDGRQGRGWTPRTAEKRRLAAAQSPAHRVPLSSARKRGVRPSSTRTHSLAGGLAEPLAKRHDQRTHLLRIDPPLLKGQCLLFEGV